MEPNKKNLLLVIGNSIAVIATLLVDALAVILPINGKSTAELADALPNLFVPAGITFAIWGIIYILIAIFMIYQILELRKKEQKNMAAIEKIGGWFMLASLGNILWIFLWQYQYVTLSLGAILILFISLLRIYLKLNIGLSTVSLREKIAVHLTISVYLGWITVATIADVTAVLVNLNVGDLFLGQANWTMLLITIVTLLTILILLRRKDIAYSLVIIWALLGIYIKRINPDPNYGVQTNIAITAAVAILIIIIVMLVKTMPTLIKKRTTT